MSDDHHKTARAGIEPLNVEQLVAGLRILDTGDVNLIAFWDSNIVSFRQTVLFAIGETSDALRLQAIPLHWRVQFENQLDVLVKYLELADRYIARRFFRCGRQGVGYRPLRRRAH